MNVALARIEQIRQVYGRPYRRRNNGQWLALIRFYTH